MFSFSLIFSFCLVIHLRLLDRLTNICTIHFYARFGYHQMVLWYRFWLYYVQHVVCQSEFDLNFISLFSIRLDLNMFANSGLKFVVWNWNLLFFFFFSFTLWLPLFVSFSCSTFVLPWNAMILRSFDWFIWKAIDMLLLLLLGKLCFYWKHTHTHTLTFHSKFKRWTDIESRDFRYCFKWCLALIHEMAHRRGNQ